MITVVANLKGGSGKSTIVFNLSVWLMHHGQQVIAYDLDPQCTLSDVARVRLEDGHQPRLHVKTAHAVYAEDLQAHEEEVLVDVGAANMQAMQTAISVADRVVEEQDQAHQHHPRGEYVEAGVPEGHVDDESGPNDIAHDDEPAGEPPGAETEG